MNETRIRFDHVSQRVRQHFESNEAMSAYFDTIYKEATDYHAGRDISLDPIDKARQKMILKHPACLVFSDLIALWNLRETLASVPPGPDGRAEVTVEETEARKAWYAIKALTLMSQRTPGREIIHTVANEILSVSKLLPRTFPDTVLKILENPLEDFLTPMKSFFLAHESN